MRKMLISLLSALVLISIASVAGAETAVKSNEEQYKALEQAKILDGFPDGQAHLEDKLTRAQAAAIIVRLFDLVLPDAKSAGAFDDVQTDHWAYPAIETAAKSGIINGSGDRTFDPSAPLKIEDFIIMVVRGLELKSKTKPSASAQIDGQVSEYAKPYVSSALANKLITAGTDYQSIASRASAVTVAYQAYQLLHDDKKADHPTETTGQGGTTSNPGNGGQPQKPNNDTTPPSVVENSVKAEGATVSVTFNEAVDVRSAHFAIQESYGNRANVPIDGVSLSTDQKTVTLSTQTSPAVLYNLSLKGVKDLAGNIMSDTSVTFVGAPSANSTSQGDKLLALTAAYQIDKSTLNVMMNKSIDFRTIKPEAFIIKDAESVRFPISSAAVIEDGINNNTIIQLILENPLQHTGAYTLEVTGLKSAAGEELAAGSKVKFAANTGSNTDTSPPIVLPSGLTEVNHSIAIPFNEPVDLSGAAFDVMETFNMDTKVSVTASLSADNKQIILSGSFKKMTLYNITITGVKDRAGNMMSSRVETIAYQGNQN